MALFGKKQTQEVALDASLLPRHIGIIMDGNGRWAKKRGLPRSAGHAAGVKVFRDIVDHCEERGIPVVTLYAFSTENWKRPQTEVDALMNLFRGQLRDALDHFKGRNIRVHFIGDRTPLAEDIRSLMEESEQAMAHKTGMTLNIAINYGGRQELAYAARRIAQETLEGKLRPEEITEDTLNERLFTAGQPDVDLILRPSGEYRLSNFLIWQSAYAEYIFNDILWPDFTGRDIDNALQEYAHRNRRFGGI